MGIRSRILLLLLTIVTARGEYVPGCYSISDIESLIAEADYEAATSWPTCFCDNAPDLAENSVWIRDGFCTTS